MSAFLKKNKENGRDRLIASALKLFSEKSFHGVSIREICEDAQVNSSLVSFHFGGKDSLLENILQQVLDISKFDYMKKILATPESELDFKIKLSIFLETYVDFYLANKEVVILFFEELERDHVMAKRIFSHTYGIIWDRLLNFLQEAQKAGFIAKEINALILGFQTMGPFFSLIRSKNTSNGSLQITLENRGFRETLIKQVVDSI